MKRTTMTEYRAGFESGMKHVDMIGCMDNRRKAEEGVNSDRPLIAAYWRGYAQGMKARAMPERVTIVYRVCGKAHPGWCY